MRVVALCGSLRAQSSNKALLRAAAGVAPAGMQVIVYEAMGSLPHFSPDLDVEPAPPEVAELRDLLAGADGLLVSSPEYAHGIPGTLKNALDWLVSDPRVAGLPVVLLNASAAGGDFAQAALVEVLRTMSLDVLVEGSQLKAFVPRKLSADAKQLDPTVARALRASLAALERAAQSRRR